MAAQNLGETIRRKQQRIVELRQEIASLQAELKEARSILSGKTPAADTREVIVTHHHPANTTAKRPRGNKRTRPIRLDSTVWWAQRLLRHWHRAENIDILVAEIERATGRPVSKATVVSNLSRYVARGDTFTRPAENVYGLIDYEGDVSMAG